MRALKNTIIYLISTIVEKGIGFLLIPIYTHYLSTKDYGILTLIQSFIAVTVIIFSLSLSGAGSRYHFDGNNLYRKLHYGNIFSLIIITSLVFTFILFYFKNTIFKLMGDIPVNPYFYLALLIAYGNIIFSIYQLKLQMEHRAFRYSINNIIKFFVASIFSIIFVVYLNKKADGVLLGQFLGLILIITFIIFFDLKKEIRLNLNKKLLIKNLKYSIFLVPHNLSGIAMQLMDRFFIANMLTVSQAGIYALGGQISGILGVLNVLINRAFTPNILKAYKDKNYKYLQDLATINILFIAILAMFFSIFSKDIMDLIAPKEYESAFIIINILSFYFVFQMYYFMIVGVLFYVEKATRLMPIITFLSLLFNLILNYFLIKIYEMIGAAIATLLSMLLVVYIVIFISGKYIQVGFNHFKIHLIIFILMAISNITIFYNLALYIKCFLAIIGIATIIFLEGKNDILSELKIKVFK